LSFVFYYAIFSRGFLKSYNQVLKITKQNDCQKVVLMILSEIWVIVMGGWGRTYKLKEVLIYYGFTIELRYSVRNMIIPAILLKSRMRVRLLYLVNTNSGGDVGLDSYAAKMS